MFKQNTIKTFKENGHECESSNVMPTLNILNPIRRIMSSTLEKTMDYDVFVKNKSNRAIHERTVKRLMKSIQSQNLLDLHPIKVNKDFEIIDGQHRLEAARRLKIEIPYIIDERLTTTSMLNLNTSQKSWELCNYFDAYVNEGIEDYVKLREFIEENKGLSLSNALQVLGGDRSGVFFAQFKEGNYKFPDEEYKKECVQKYRYIKETQEYIKKKTSGSKIYIDKVTFLTGLIEFFNNKSFDYKVFLAKLQYKIDLIRPCSHQSHYVALFKTIYNWKNQNPLYDYHESRYLTKREDGSS